MISQEIREKFIERVLSKKTTIKKVYIIFYIKIDLFFSLDFYRQLLNLALNFQPLKQFYKLTRKKGESEKKKLEIEVKKITI